MAGSSAASGISGFTQLTDALRTIYSKKAYQAALPQLKYEEVFSKIEEFDGREAGQTITLPRFGRITEGGVLAENATPTAQALSVSWATATLATYGNAVSITERLEKDSFIDIPQAVFKALSDDFAMVYNKNLRARLVAAGSVMYTDPTYASHSDVTDADILDVATIRRAVTTLQEANAPMFEDQYYICYASPHQLEHIQRDPLWQDLAISGEGGAPVRAGAVGKLSNVLFISTTMQGNGAVASTADGYEAALDDAGAGDIDLYRATIVAEDAVGVGWNMPFELRLKRGDYDVNWSLAWFARWGTATLNTERVLHIITA